jgi:hypothetical protein
MAMRGPVLSCCLQEAAAFETYAKEVHEAHAYARFLHFDFVNQFIELAQLSRGLWALGAGQLLGVQEKEPYTWC